MGLVRVKVRVSNGAPPVAAGSRICVRSRFGRQKRTTLWGSEAPAQHWFGSVSVGRLVGRSVGRLVFVYFIIFFTYLLEFRYICLFFLVSLLVVFSVGDSSVLSRLGLEFVG